MSNPRAPIFVDYFALAALFAGVAFVAFEDFVAAMSGEEETDDDDEQAEAKTGV